MKSRLQNKALTAGPFTIFLDAVGVVILIPVFASLVLLSGSAETAILLSPLIPLFVAPAMANSIALLSSLADRHEQGEVMSVNSSLEALAHEIPAVLSGYVASVAVGLPSVIGGILVGMAWIVFMLFFKPSSIKHAQVH